METREITTEQKAMLIRLKEHFKHNDTGRFYYLDMDSVYEAFHQVCILAGADFNTLNKVDSSAFGVVKYFQEEDKYIVRCEIYIEQNMSEKLSVELTSDIDFIGLNTKEADTSLENFFNDSLENVVRKLREIYPDVVENIEQNVISHIRDYELEDSDRDWIAQSYIEDYPADCVEKAESYLSDDDKKRFICDWVDNL